MAFRIDTFIANMQRDGARPNLFEIFFSNPGGGGIPVPTDMQFKAKATALPASSVGVASTFYFGRQAKFAGNRVFGDWAVNILLDEQDFRAGARAFLENWSNNINKHVANTRETTFVTPQNYMMDGLVRQYAKDNSGIIAEYKMAGCFPIDVGAIPVDWEANDRIMEFQVTFAMQWWERVGVTDTGAAL